MFKNIIVFILLQLTSGILIAGGYKEQAVSWVHKYSYDDGFQTNSLSAQALISTQDGGFLIGNGGIFLKLNSMGQTQWMRHYVCCWTSFLVESSSNGYVSAGTADYLDESDVRVSKIDRDGNVIWDKHLKISRFNRTHSLIRTRDGGYLIGAFSSSRSTGIDGKAWLIKLTPSGEIKWQKTYNVAQPTSLHQLSNGDFLVATYQFSVLRISPIGKVRWQKKYIGDSCCYEGIMQAVGENGFTLAGTRRKDSIDSVVLIRADSTGSVIFSKLYARQGLEDFKRTSDGEYILLSEGSFPHKTFVTKLDANGIIKWRRVSKTFLTARNILQAKDDGYVLTEGSEGWVIKLNQFGNVPNACRSIFGPSSAPVENIEINVQNRFPTIHGTRATPFSNTVLILDASPVTESICSR
jgi:hypothetical protein